MSLNTAHANGGVLIYSGERILIYYDGVEMAFDMEHSMPQFKGSKKGRVYLTTHRVIFNNKSLKDGLQSFSIPFFSMKEVELEQPVFGANYIKGKVIAEAGGNWEGAGKFKIWFNNGGAIDFGRAMLKAGNMASRHAPRNPPPYTPPSANYYQAPPPAYSPPQDPMYGFVPYATFPSAPPSDGVYMYEAPPPYPGIVPTTAPYRSQAPHSSQAQGAQAPYPPNAPMTNGVSHAAADAKASEAAASAYYSPPDPHNVYMPQQAPPPYSEAAKKTQ